MCIFHEFIDTFYYIIDNAARKDYTYRIKVYLRDDRSGWQQGLPAGLQMSGLRTRQIKVQGTANRRQMADMHRSETVCRDKDRKEIVRYFFTVLQCKRDFIMNKILIVEADFKLAERLCRALTDNETHAFSCGTLEAASALLESEQYQRSSLTRNFLTATAMTSYTIWGWGSTSRTMCRSSLSPQMTGNPI